MDSPSPWEKLRNIYGDNASAVQSSGIVDLLSKISAIIDAGQRNLHTADLPAIEAGIQRIDRNLTARLLFHGLGLVQVIQEISSSYRYNPELIPSISPLVEFDEIVSQEIPMLDSCPSDSPPSVDKTRKVIIPPRRGNSLGDLLTHISDTIEINKKEGA